MSAYCSNAAPEEVARRILSSRRVLLATHAKPDGDAMGSVLAMRRALRARGIEADIHLNGPLEPRLRELAAETPFTHADGPPAEDYDLVVLLDTGSWSQLEAMADWLRQRSDRIVVVDHHAKGDDIGALRLVDASAASTTQMLASLLETMGCELTGGPGGVAEALFVGLATDTGWFRYSSADADALETAASLLRRGVDKARLYQMIEETFRPQRLALMARALRSVAYLLDGSVAMMTLRREDFRETGGDTEDTAELVNAPMPVRVVRVSILLVQTSAGRVKLSFRSKPPTAAGAAPGLVDMNRLAQHFGGGGHLHAAGASVAMSVDEARDAVTAAVEAEARAAAPAADMAP